MRRLHLAVLALCVAATALPAAAHTTPSVTITSVGDGVVRGDLGPWPAALDAAPLRAAEAVLGRWADQLGVDAGAFRFETVRRSVIGVHVRGREHRGGVPVDSTAAAVHVVGGRVRIVEARGLGGLPGAPVATPVSAAVAVQAALTATGTEAGGLLRIGSARLRTRTAAERLLTAGESALDDVWRVSVLSFAPPVAADVDVSARDGQVVAVHDARVYADGSAMVFDPNPVVTLRDSSLREPGVDTFGVDTDLDSPALTAARVKLPLRGIDELALLRGRLAGPWVDVQGPAPLVGTTGLDFDTTRSDPRFEMQMVYAHLDRVQRYFQSLGFVGEASILAKPQLALAVVIPGYDNSFYHDGFKLLAFGSGGVDDAEDAEVILHEYGHAVHYDQVPNWGRTHEGGSMGEGFGDFLAAAYYARDISGGFQDPCVADWDAVSYSSASPPCLRRTDTAKTYPADMRNQVHSDGEIWSGFLWDLRATLGETSQERTDNMLWLVLASHELLTSQARFADAVAALRTVAALRDADDPELGWEARVVAAAQARGLPVGP